MLLWEDAASKMTSSQVDAARERPSRRDAAASSVWQEAFAYGQYHGGAEPPTANARIETFEPVMRRWAVDLASHERDASRVMTLERAAAASSATWRLPLDGR